MRNCYKVFLDANILLDFCIDQETFKIFCDFLETNFDTSIFSLSTYTVEEITFCSFRKFFEDIFCIMNLTIEDISSYEPPPEGMDLGEWLLYLLAKKEDKACIMTNDIVARKFFSDRGLLPCKFINPPHDGVGGTKGILKHLQLRGYLSVSDKHRIEQKMKKHGRKIG